MSEKRVNVKITASTSGFDNAIKKAQSKIDKLADSINDMSNGKFGNKLEKQFDNLAQATKKTSEQIDDIQKLLDSLNKTKFTKLDKRFDEITKTAEKLQDGLDDISKLVTELNKAKLVKIDKQFRDITDSSDKLNDSLDDVSRTLDKLNKVKLVGIDKQFSSIAESSKEMNDQLEKTSEALEKLNKAELNSLISQFKDVMDSNDKLNNLIKDVIDILAKLDNEDLNNIQDAFRDLINNSEDVSKEVKDLLEWFEKLDKQDLNNLEDEFEQVQKAINDLGIKIKDTTDDIEKCIDDVTKEIEDFNKELNEVDDTELEQLGDTIQDIDKYIDDLNRQFDELDRELDDLDTNELEDIENSIKDIDKYVDDATNEFKDFNKELDDIDTVELEDVENAFKDIDNYTDDATNELKDFNKELDDIDTIEIINLEDIFKDVDKHTSNATNELKDFNKELNDIDSNEFKDLEVSIKDTDRYIESMRNSLETFDRELDNLDNENLDEIYETMRRLDETTEDLYDSFKRTFNSIEDMGKINFDFGDKGPNNFIASLIEGFISGKIAGEAMENSFKDVAESIDRMSNSLKDAGAEMKETLGFVADDFRILKNNAEEASLEFLGQEAFLDTLIRLYSQLDAELMDAYDKGDQENIEKYSHALNVIEDNIRKNLDEHQKLDDVLDEIEQRCQALDDVMHKQVDAYEKVRKETIKFIDSHKKAIITNKDVADSFIKLHNSMEKVYKEVKPLPDDMFERLTKEAEECREALNLISTDNLMRNLERLSKTIDNTTEKTSKFQQMNREGYHTHKAAQELTDSMKEIQSFTERMGISVQKVGDTFVWFADKVEDANEELDTKRIDEYMEAMNEFAMLVRDSGGKISETFADINGQLDPSKYLAYFEKFGEPLQQITMKLEKYRVQLLENLKAEKENADANKEAANKAKENAEAIRDKAKETKDAIQAEVDHAAKIIRTSNSMKEISAATKAYHSDSERLAEAKEKLKKAEEDYVKAAEKAKNVDKDRIESASKLVKAFNDEAEAARKLGASIKDITQADISSFDKSLGTLISDIFPDDLPKKFSDFKEDIKALFADLNVLDLGGTIDNFKNLLSGVFDMIPGKVKIAIAAIAAIGTALKACADVGVEQFKQGIGTIGTAFDKLKDIAREVGQEVKDAFENITDMELDLGSIIEQVVEFEGTITKAGVASEATEKQLQLLENRAREIGATSRYSATDVAEAMDELASAGWTAQDILEGIEGVVNLSEGSFISLGEAAEFVANGLTSLGMQTNQATDFVDKMSQAAISTSTDIGQMRMAFTNCASTAGMLGVSATDLATALGLMANQGVKGAKAGTALKNLMANMASPTEKMTKCLQAYNLEGVQTDIVNGNLMDGVLKLKDAFDKNNVSVKEQVEVISTLAGKEALPGVAALLNNTAETMNSLRFAVDSSTKSSRAYAESLGLVDKEGKMAFDTFEKMIEVKGKEYEQWQNFNNVLNDSAAYMTMVGGTTTDLGAIIHKLGEDGQVTSDNIASLVDIFGKMRESNAETTKTLSEYGIEVAKTEDGVFDFGETVKNLGSVWDTLNDSQKQQLTTQLGVETSVEELNELFSNEGDKIEDLIGSYEKMQGVSEHLARSFDSTLKGAILNLSSAMEERFLQIFDQIKDGVLDATKTFETAFNIWNGLADEFGSGFLDAMEYLTSNLEKQSQGWGKAIEDGLHNAISTLDKFVNSASFDNMLQIGTNIINGIADGIQRAANDGSLDNAISGAINKIATWCSNNLDTIIEVGRTIINSISNGITENQDEIGEVIKGVIDLQTEIDGAVAFEKGRLFGENFGTFIGKGIESKLTEWIASFGGFMSGLFGTSDVTIDTGDGEMMYVPDYTGMTGGTWIEVGNSIGTDIGDGVNKGVSSKIESNKETLSNTVDQNFKDTKVKTDQTATDIGTGISDNIMAKLETMDASQLKALGQELQTLQEITEAVSVGVGNSFTAIQDSARTSMTGMTNIFRNQFTNMSDIVRTELVNCANIVTNQMTNMTDGIRNGFTNMYNITNNQFTNIANSIRTQMINCSNIVSNQMTSMADTFRTQFVNMSNIATNQMTNVSNTVRTQFVNMSNIVNNQATNMANNFRTQFTNMANIARNQMTSVSNTVRTEFTNMSNIVRNQASNMSNSFRTEFTNMTNIARNQMTTVSSTVRTEFTNMSNIVKNQASNMASSFRTEFTNMSNIAKNQMSNVSSTIRSEATNWSNIIKNQITNSRDTFTSQMLSMASVARTQMVNISNIIRNQAVTWANIISNQSANARNNLTSQFISMSKVVNTQMANCLASVKSYMSQIVSATNKTMTMNFKVNKTVTTTNVTKNVTQNAAMPASEALYAANTASTFSLGRSNNMSAFTARASSVSTSLNSVTSGSVVGTGEAITLEIPMIIDGKEVARSTAKYMDGELKMISRRDDRKRGVK